MPARGRVTKTKNTRGTCPRQQQPLPSSCLAKTDTWRQKNTTNTSPITREQQERYRYSRAPDPEYGDSFAAHFLPPTPFRSALPLLFLSTGFCHASEAFAGAAMLLAAALVALLPATTDGFSCSNGEVVKLGLWLMLLVVCSSERRTAALGSFLLFLAAVVLVLGLTGDVASGTSFPLAE